MSFNDIMMWVIAAGMIIGGIDIICGNRLGIGKTMEEGFMCLGPTVLSMVGMIELVPVVSAFLKPGVVWLFHLTGADPAMFASVIALDMGGYPLAVELADSPLSACFGGLLEGSMLGAAVVFTIPVGMGLIEKEDKVFFARGILIGLVPIPVGSIAGGLMMGMSIPQILINLVPVILISGCLIAGLVFAGEAMEKGFMAFAKGIRIFSTIGLCIGCFTRLTGVTLIKEVPDVMEGMIVAVNICVVLAGTLPVVTLIVRLTEKPLGRLGEKVGLDSAALVGILSSVISVLPVLKMFKDISPRGKVVCTAFMTSSSAVFAAHMGYVMSVKPDMYLPVMTGKLVSAVLAGVLAWVMTMKYTAVKAEA